MTQQRDEEQAVERGAAEDTSGTPLTETEVDAAHRPPSEPQDQEGRPIEGGYGS